MHCTKDVFVEGSGEVHVEELLVVDGKGHHPASKPEVAEVVWINIRVTIGLECSTWEGGKCDNIHSLMWRHGGTSMYHQQTV